MSSTAVLNHTNFPNVFVTSNEQGRSEALERFDKIDCVGTAAVGVSGMGFLNFVSRKEQFDKIIAVDVNPKVQKFWKIVTPIIQNATSRLGCARSIRRAVRVHGPELFGLSSGSRINRENSRLSEEIAEGISWLSNHERFQRIQNIFRSRGGFTSLHADLRFLAENRGFQQALGNSQTGFFYPSNVCDYIKTNTGQEIYAKSIDAFTHEATVVVHSEEDLVQHVLLKEDYVPDFPEPEEMVR